MPNNAKAIVVHVKSQASVGTAATITPGSDEALRVIGRPTFTVRGEGAIERVDLVSAVGPGLQPVTGSRGWDISFQTELYRYSDIADDTSSPLAPLFAASSLVEENANGSTNLEITFSRTASIGTTVGTNYVPFTIEVDEIGGNTYSAYDCLCTVALSLDTGGRILLDWTVQGSWIDVVASTLGATTATFGADPLPFVAKAASLSSDLGDYPAISTMSLTTGMALVERPDVSATDGFAPSFLDLAEVPVLGFTCDADDATTLPIWAEVFAGTASNLTATFTDAGNETFKIALPVAYPRVPTPGGDAFQSYDIEFYGTPNASGDALVLTFDTA